jgi:CRISPR system Cascade subunit CasE
VFLSRIRLNPSRLQTRRLVASPQVTHALVEASAPPGSEHHRGRSLWRLDQDRAHGLELYVVSPWRPDFTGLVEQAGWPLAPTWDCAPYGGFLDRLADGQRWRFRVTVNPTRSLATEGGRGQVAPHRTSRHQTEWFVDRAVKWGFVIPDNSIGAASLSVVDRRVVRFARRDASTGGAVGWVSITSVTFEGVLEVASGERLRGAMTNGMGRAKSYGCGLMTLAPSE